MNLIKLKINTKNGAYNYWFGINLKTSKIIKRKLN